MAVTRDFVTGGALCVVGAAMAITAHGFPVVGGMAYGPGLFPTIIAVGLIVSGAAIVAEGFTASGPAPEETPAPPRRWPMFGVLGIIVFFALTLDPLGFHIAAAISLAISVRLFGGGWVMTVATALIGAVVLHYIFYSVLRVPLPWGVLLPFAW